MLKPYVRAAFPAVAVSTVEEDRFAQHLLTEFPEKTVLLASAIGGLKDLRTGTLVDAGANVHQAFALAAQNPDTLLVVFDWQHVARNAAAYRALKDQFAPLKANGCCIVLVAPAWTLPSELEHDVPLLEWALPSREQLREALHIVADSVGETATEEQEVGCLDAAAGLTLQEAENSFALALVERGTLDPLRVQEEKMRLVKNSGYLEFWPSVQPGSVGGLAQLKDYFEQEVMPCRDEVDLRVRGVLLVGVSGTGKSLASKAAGAVLGWPVLRLDISALKGSLVGQSEANMRAALKLAEAVAPCVLWLDEIEKGVGGYQSSAHTDSGVTLGMVGALLTWMQEHRSPILSIATCNDYNKLPVELTRAGRFDERFFVDLPTSAERLAIAEIHLHRFGCSADGLAPHIAQLTTDWTGAEIEQLVKSAARRSGRRPTPEVLSTCAKDIKPIARVRAGEVEALRTWARESLRGANTPEDTPAHSRHMPSATAKRRNGNKNSDSFGFSLN
jgi:hypothetical protein